MNGILIDYARVSTADQDLTSQRDALLRLGVLDSNIYVDHGLTGTNRARPGLRDALAAVREGDTLVVTKLDRLARSVRDAPDIADELTTKGVALSLGGSRYDPTDPVGRLLFNVLAMVAEFERDLMNPKSWSEFRMTASLTTAYAAMRQSKAAAARMRPVFHSACGTSRACCSSGCSHAGKSCSMSARSSWYSCGVRAEWQ